MSNTLKQPMSGLRSIKRDFSSSSLPPASQESLSSDPDTIPWQPTPPKKLSGLEQRLKDIQDALNAQVSSSSSVLASSSQSQKRPSTSQNPPAKRRQLPPSWDDKPPSQASRPAYPSAASQRAFGKPRQTNTNETTLVVAAKSGSSAKPAPIFLSQEQTHILKLVESGLSLFYTGSAGAGKSVLLREIIRTLRKKYRTAADAVAVTASTGRLLLSSFLGICLTSLCRYRCMQRRGSHHPFLCGYWHWRRTSGQSHYPSSEEQESHRALAAYQGPHHRRSLDA
ncbi:hypothetical protein BD311DRAFT_217892 [Dichomitus squalens]|uniref:ATP-dependent DNA helicase n=1 Tax=Dichomitus squalens TaxID=114155 RepID=A0A4Q9MRP8_9APHY|nr:hypothetical protein BD311DRAFT_217892 [Dichomitus squalens]